MRDVQEINVNLPEPEQFGLTPKRADHFKKATETNLWIIFFPIALNFFDCLALSEFVFPRIHIPFLLFLLLALYPGFMAGVAIDDRRKSRVLNSPDYGSYLKYTKALKNYREALRNRNDLLRQIRREQFRNRQKAENEARKREEWWRGIDGKGFELGVAKVLMDKGYNVKHTGSSSGDEGVDLVLKIDNKRIIIQCKAFSSYDDPADYGRYVPVRLGKIVHRVITHPRAAEQFKAKVDDLMRKHLKRIRRENSCLLP